jgi:hypothetical protein
VYLPQCFDGANTTATTPGANTHRDSVIDNSPSGISGNLSYGPVPRHGHKGAWQRLGRIIFWDQWSWRGT